jgi:predicted PurR-regulated permease PerM
MTRSITKPAQAVAAGDAAGDWANERNGKQLVLVGLTLGLLVLCLRLVDPFLPALVGAITVAVVTHRLWMWLHKRIKATSVAAGIAVVGVAVTVLLPIIFLVFVAATEIVATVQAWQKEPLTKQLSERLAGYPRVEKLWHQFEANLDLTSLIQQVGQQVQAIGTAIFSGIAYTVVQAALMLFVLYYLYRDEATALAAARRYTPLSDSETDRLFSRLTDTIHATIFGSVVVAMIQGSLGSLIFWLLGLPGAAVWGVTMGLLAMVPYMGTFVVWAPAAAVLALNGEYTRAGILVAWGMCVIAMIDNLVYPMLVGTRLRQHTVVSFIAVLGGITLFGASGIVLGPLLMTSVFTLLEIWRERAPKAESVLAA